MEGREGIRVKLKIIPLPPVDCGDVVKDGFILATILE